MARSSKFEKASEEHREAVERFAAAAGGMDESEWRSARADGKWTGAELGEHLVLTYEVALAELAGKQAIRPRVSAFMATVLRMILLPHVLFHKSMPLRAKSPREIRPTGSRSDRDELVELLATRSSELVVELKKAYEQPGLKLSHPYFGPIRPLQLLRFLTVHLDHHRRQLQSLGGERAGR